MPLFEYRAYSKRPEIRLQAQALIAEMLKEYRRKPSKARISSLTKWMKVAISGLYMIGGYQRGDVQIPTGRNHYQGSTRRSPMYQSELLDCFNWLIKNGYAEQTKAAHQNQSGKWIPASYRLTRKWLDIAAQFCPYEARQEQILQSITRNPDAPLVELRKDGKRIRLRKHPEKSQWIARIQAYNRRLESHQIRLNGEIVSPVVFSVTRIFNDGEFTRGGRYYSTFQGFKSQLRLLLTIDGEPVVELDYKGLHPSLLYQRAGLPEPTQDAYTIEGYPRKLVKKAFNILINRKKPAPATQSLIFYLNKNKQEYVHDQHLQPPTIDKAYCEALERAIRDHHQPIEQFFCTGVGLELQYHDSLICSSVFDYFLVKTDSIVLAVHDSFIVKQSDMHHLAEALKYAEHTVAKRLDKPYREPELEAEIIKLGANYDQLLVSAFGETISTKTIPEDAVLEQYLNEELELLDDSQSLSDADADAEEDLELR